jgi:hypothetical protein
LNCEKLEVVGGKEVTGEPVCIKQNMTNTLEIKHKIICEFTQLGMNYTYLPQNTNYTNLRTREEYPTFADVTKSFKYFVNVDEGKVKKISKFNKFKVCFNSQILKQIEIQSDEF